ncbi:MULTISPECIES: phage tail family protein [unclassified Crossiella]|uniref:phage tail family protein n=1 Tax=unclassified Crossiella TaxID=2620835 RepID=UPI001FFFF7F0|nr:MULTISPECIES: phage tail family protein [unclassified Crossiella]MCK2237704.1 phage tail family protein [Crossiella sp. S99.2]MCK2254990.1 phage tail family protein [Crossiella sp. S99.1]
MLDGLQFNGNPDPLDLCTYVVATETGWSGSTRGRVPPAVGATEPARVITLSGWVAAPSWEARRRAELRLAALCALDQDYELRCTTELGERVMTVRRDAETTVAIRSGGYELDFSVQLGALDGRRYDAQLQSADTGLANGENGGLDFETGGGLEFEPTGLDFGPAGSSGHARVSTFGTAATSPRFVLDGPLTPPVTISRHDTGARLVYTAPIGTGERIAIDVQDRTVTLGGTTTSRRHNAIVHDWNALIVPPAGLNGPATVDYALSHGATPNTTARLAVQWRDAWH